MSGKTPEAQLTAHVGRHAAMPLVTQRQQMSSLQRSAERLLRAVRPQIQPPAPAPSPQPGQSMTARLKLPDGTRQKLARFQQRVWKIKLIEGICAAIFGLIATYLLVFVLDRFIETPGWLRLALLFSVST